jgi:hypothetical protein
MKENRRGEGKILDGLTGIVMVTGASKIINLNQRLGITRQRKGKGEKKKNDDFRFSC